VDAPTPGAGQRAHRPKVHGQQHDADHKVGDKLALVDDFAHDVEYESHDLLALFECRGGKTGAICRGAEKSFLDLRSIAQPLPHVPTPTQAARHFKHPNAPSALDRRPALKMKWQKNATGCVGAGASSAGAAGGCMAAPRRRRRACFRD
jgi:hypothetical protein